MKYGIFMIIIIIIITSDISILGIKQHSESFDDDDEFRD